MLTVYRWCTRRGHLFFLYFFSQGAAASSVTADVPGSNSASAVLRVFFLSLNRNLRHVWPRWPQSIQWQRDASRMLAESMERSTSSPFRRRVVSTFAYAVIWAHSIWSHAENISQSCPQDWDGSCILVQMDGFYLTWYHSYVLPLKLAILNLSYQYFSSAK